MAVRTFTLADVVPQGADGAVVGSLAHMDAEIAANQAAIALYDWLSRHYAV